MFVFLLLFCSSFRRKKLPSKAFFLNSDEEEEGNVDLVFINVVDSSLEESGPSADVYT